MIRRATAITRLPQAGVLLCAAAALLALPDTAAGDAIVRTRAMTASTIAEIFVERDTVRLELEIGMPDLHAFGNLLPDGIHRELGLGDEPFAARLREFLTEQWVVVADGEPLPGQLVRIGPSERIRRDEISGEPLPDDEEPETVVRVEIGWPLPEPEPARVELALALAGASVGFVAYHEGVAVNDFRYMTPSQILLLDWEDPWYSRFEQRTLRRQYYAPMAGFIYVEPYEVRKEIIARPKDLQRWVDLGLEGRSKIPVEMQADVLRKAAEFLADHQPVTIDGKPAQHDLVRADFLERTLKTSRVIDPPEELDIDSAMLGVIFVYPHPAFADTVTMEWDLFDERIQTVPVSGVDPVGPLPQFVEPDAPMLEWKNFIRIPVMPQLAEIVAPPSPIASALHASRILLYGLAALALGVFAHAAATGFRHRARAATAAIVAAAALAGSGYGNTGNLRDETTRDVVAGLLTNTYRAFDFRDESEVYDVLARSVEGELLREVYLEMRRGLVLASQGGASARVKEVELVELETAPAPDRGISARATWRVRAAVGHWGHIHERRNEYRANLRLRPVEGAWKLVGVEILDEVRL